MGIASPPQKSTGPISTAQVKYRKTAADGHNLMTITGQQNESSGLKKAALKRVFKKGLKDLYLKSTGLTQTMIADITGVQSDMGIRTMLTERIDTDMALCRLEIYRKQPASKSCKISVQDALKDFIVPNLTKSTKIELVALFSTMGFKNPKSELANWQDILDRNRELADEFPSMFILRPN